MVHITCKDTDEVFLKGSKLTVEEIRKRFNIAIAINNSEVVKILYDTDRPLSAIEIATILNHDKKDVPESLLKNVKSSLKKLNKNYLLATFSSEGRTVKYLLKYETALSYQKSLKLNAKVMPK